jgi:exonuclease III
MLVYKITTLNINGITNHTRLKMLEDFIHQHDIDIVLLQEVTCMQLQILDSYAHHINIGMDKRGTAIMAKHGTHLINIQKLPSGRGIAATYNGTRLVNIYAPSGAEKKQQREQFFNQEITYLLTNNQPDLILAGGFNCVLDSTDATGQNNYSRALANLIRGLNLTDAWNPRTKTTTYTHYAPTGASRIDRFYISNNIKDHKQNIETLAAAFTDHFAVILHMNTDIPHTIRGKSHWKMNVSLLNNETFKHTLQTLWTKWRAKNKYYTDTTMWWERCVKPAIRQTFIREGAGRKRDRRAMENFYYAAIYDLLNTTNEHTSTAITLKHLKAQIIRLHHKELQSIFLDNNDQDKIDGEEPTIYHIIKQKKDKQHER